MCICYIYSFSTYFSSFIKHYNHHHHHHHHYHHHDGPCFWQEKGKISRKKLWYEYKYFAYKKSSTDLLLEEKEEAVAV